MPVGIYIPVIYVYSVLTISIIILTPGGVDSDQKLIDVRMRAVGRKIIILSGKGGSVHIQCAHTSCSVMMCVVNTSDRLSLHVSVAFCVMS